MPTKKPIIHCDALVVHCMDYRLQKFIQPWITVRFGYDNFDIISLAGGVHDYEMVLKYVQLAVQIHTIETVCLINHEDCRAYGRDGTYKRHKHDLMDAQKKIQSLIPSLESGNLLPAFGWNLRVKAISMTHSLFM
jgi:carbonic anhydrase